jgi:hypothetical protein
VPDRYRALVLVGAYAGLRWGEAAGLTRDSVDLLRSRILVRTTAVEDRGRVSLGHEPKTRRSKRAVPVARSIMRRIEEHLSEYVGPESDALVFTASKGGPLFRSTFARHVWHPAVTRAGLDGFTFHGLRHSFVASWSRPAATSARSPSGPGNSVAFTLTRYGACLRTARLKRSTALRRFLAARGRAARVRKASRLVSGGIPNGIRTRAAALKGRLGR